MNLAMKYAFAILLLLSVNLTRREHFHGLLLLVSLEDFDNYSLLLTLRPVTAEQMFSIAARGVYNLAINKMYYRLCSRSVNTDIFDIEPDPQTDDHLVSVCFISNSGEYSCANKKTPSHLRICPCTNQGYPSICMYAM